MSTYRELVSAASRLTSRRGPREAARILEAVAGTSVLADVPAERRADVIRAMNVG